MYVARIEKGKSDWQRVSGNLGSLEIVHVCLSGRLLHDLVLIRFFDGYI